MASLIISFIRFSDVAYAFSNVDVEICFFFLKADHEETEENLTNFIESSPEETSWTSKIKLLKFPSDTNRIVFRSKKI